MSKFKKPILIAIALLLMFTMISSYAYAQKPQVPNINVHWDDDLQQVLITWDKPLERSVANQEGFRLQYKTPEGNWKLLQTLSLGATSVGANDLEPNTTYSFRIVTSVGVTDHPSNQVSVTTPKDVGFACSAHWTGSGIHVTWNNANKGVVIDTYCDGELKLPSDGWAFSSKKKSHNGVLTFRLNTKDQPRQGETWTLVFHHDGKAYSHTVTCGKEKEDEDGEGKDEDGIVTPNKPGGGDSGDPYQIKGPIPIFTQETWPTVMFWYMILASLSGAFIFLALIRSGYQYMFSATSNPGLKASFSETIEKCIIALVVIMSAPMLVGLLIQINDGLVGVFANVLDTIGSVDDMGLDDISFEVNFINKMIAWPIKLIFIDLPNKLFGLHPLSHLIFNNETEVIDPCIFMGYFNSGDPLDLGDPLATVIVTLIFAVFNMIFNAIYTIRGWVVTAVLCATPLVVWIWVLSAQKTVIEIWLSELFQTIFMQTWHALTFAIVFSILLLRGRTPSAVPSITDNLAEILIMAGKFFAAFGGIVCVGVIIYCSYKLIIGLAVTGDSKHIAEYKTNLQKALIGLVILSLALIITQTIFPHEVPVLEPNISGGHAPKITVWQIFFAFFVILPISKMMSNIFMSLLARFGTVDEQALATRGFGMLGGLATLGVASAAGARGAYLSNEQQATRIDEARRSMNGGSGPGGSPGGLGSSPGGPGSSPSGSGSSPSGFTPSGTGQTSYNQGESNIFASSGDREYESGGLDLSQPYTSNASVSGSPSGNIPGSPSGNISTLPGSPAGDMSTLPGSPSGGISDGSSGVFAGATQPDAPGIYPDGGYSQPDTPGIYPDNSQPEVPGIYPSPSSSSGYSDSGGYVDNPAAPQESGFRERLSTAGYVGAGSVVATGIENTMRYGGFLAGSVVGQGQTGAAIFGGVGKHMGNVARTFSTGYNLYSSVRGENRTQTLTNLRDLTGSATNRGAIVQAGIGTALMPLGSHRASASAKKIGSLLDLHH